MIEKIVIKGFQKHSSITLTLDPAITCIAGPNDVGKTTVLRALHWLAFNRPAGNSMVNWDTDTAMVKVVVDGHTIIHKKGKRNYYSLDGKKFKAVGTSVPPEIAELLNLEVTNFQFAKDPPFWLSLSPGQVSKELNQIVDLGIIDSSLAKVGANLRKSKSKVEVLEEQLKEVRLQRSSLKWTVEAVKEHDLLTKKQVLIDEISHQIDQLQILTDQCVLHRKRIKIDDALVVACRFSTLSAEKCHKLNLRVNKLQQLIGQYERREETITLNDIYITNIQKQLQSIRICPACQRRI